MAYREREKHLLKLRTYYYANREKILAQKHLYSLAHRDEKKITDKKYYLLNHDKILEQRKNYRKENRERILKYLCEWRRKNGRNAEYFRAYQKRMIKESIQFHLSRVLRNRLNKFVRGVDKKGSAIKLLGCSLKKLKQHLEEQFRENMSWDNYGSWSIDHKIPLSLFDLQDENQLAMVCHYTNLQPLWVKENSSKGNRISEIAIGEGMGKSYFFASSNTLSGSHPVKTQIIN